MSSPGGKIAVALLLMAGTSTGLSSQSGGGAGTLVATIPAGYQAPAGGWTPACNADGTVCAYRGQQGAQTFVLANGKPGTGYDEVGAIVVSKDGQHVAYEAKRRNKWVVVADGKEGPEFDKLERLRFFGNIPLYVGSGESRLRDDPGVFNGTRRVEGFRSNGVAGTQPILDVVVGEKIDDIPVIAEERRGPITDITISPDEKHYAYIHEERGSDGPGALWSVMLDGQLLTEDHGLEIFGFTADNRIVFASRTGSFADGRAKVMFDEKITTSRTGDITAGAVSLDGRRVAYVACTGSVPARRQTPRVLGKCQLVVDEKPLRDAQELVLNDLKFSPDGATLAFTEQLDPKGPMKMYVADKPGPAFDSLAAPIVFSANGERHAYAAKIGTTQVVVVDGVAGPAFDSVANIRFSADSAHVAYTAVKAGAHHVVVDTGTSPTGVAWAGAPWFDAAGQNVMFVAQEGQHFSRRSIAVRR